MITTEPKQNFLQERLAKNSLRITHLIADFDHIGYAIVASSAFTLVMGGLAIASSNSGTAHSLVTTTCAMLGGYSVCYYQSAYKRATEELEFYKRLDASLWRKIRKQKSNRSSGGANEFLNGDSTIPFLPESVTPPCSTVASSDTSENKALVYTSTSNKKNSSSA